MLEASTKRPVLTYPLIPEQPLDIVAFLQRVHYLNAMIYRAADGDDSRVLIPGGVLVEPDDPQLLKELSQKLAEVKKLALDVFSHCTMIYSAVEYRNDVFVARASAPRR